MKGDGELDGPEDLEEPSKEAEEQEPQRDIHYDPLTDPWNDPVSASIVEYRLARGETAWRQPRTGPYLTPEASELRRRLREETVVLPRRGRVWSVTARELVETLLLAVLIFLAVRASMQNFRVEGASMEPSLDDGEYLIVNKLAYTEFDLGLLDWLPFVDSGDDPLRHVWDSPGRGDVIVFKSPTNIERDFIKRIIGEPGDIVEIDRTSGRVMINGEVLDEPYIQGSTTCQSSCGPWVVPEASYFVMGDNRQNSSDSRQGWFVPEENIIGKAFIVYWQDGAPELNLAPNHDVSIVDEAAAQE